MHLFYCANVHMHLFYCIHACRHIVILHNSVCSCFTAQQCKRMLILLHHSACEFVFYCTTAHANAHFTAPQRMQTLILLHHSVYKCSFYCITANANASFTTPQRMRMLLLLNNSACERFFNCTTAHANAPFTAHSFMRPKIQVLFWPARSPDMNVTPNLWATMVQGVEQDPGDCTDTGPRGGHRHRTPGRGHRSTDTDTKCAETVSAARHARSQNLSSKCNSECKPLLKVIYFIPNTRCSTNLQ